MVARILIKLFDGSGSPTTLAVMYRIWDVAGARADDNAVAGLTGEEPADVINAAVAQAARAWYGVGGGSAWDLPVGPGDQWTIINPLVDRTV